MNLSHLYYFKKLAELEHYTKAAKELYITQPSLSDAIASLEDELGLALFKKEGRNIRLTRYGKEFHYYVCSALNELETGITIAKERSGLLGGVVEIGCIPTLLGDFIPRAVKGYQKKRNAQVKFNIHMGASLEVIDGIKSGIYDLGFCSKVDTEADLIFVPILTQRLIALVHQDHPLAALDSCQFKDCATYPLLTYRKQLPIGKAIHDLFHANQLDASFTYDDEITIGGIVSTTPDLVAIVAETPFLKQFDQLVHIPLTDAPADIRTIYLAYHGKHFIHKAAESFASYIVAEEMTLPTETASKDSSGLGE